MPPRKRSTRALRGRSSAGRRGRGHRAGGGRNRVRFAVVENDKWPLGRPHRRRHRHGREAAQGDPVHRATAKRPQADANGVKEFAKNFMKHLSKDHRRRQRLQKNLAHRCWSDDQHGRAFPTRYNAAGDLRALGEDQRRRPSCGSAASSPMPAASASWPAASSSTVKEGTPRRADHRGAGSTKPFSRLRRAVPDRPYRGNRLAERHLRPPGHSTPSPPENLCAFTIERRQARPGGFQDRLRRRGRHRHPPRHDRPAGGDRRGAQPGHPPTPPRPGNLEDIAVHVKGLEPAGLRPSAAQRHGPGLRHLGPRGLPPAGHLLQAGSSPE